MKYVVDASDYQAGLALDTVAASVDGAWFKAGDWAYVSRHGWPADDIHDAAIVRFTQLRKPVGTYFFVRPGSTDPETQINGWAQHAPTGLSMKPMIDLEKTTISGSSLRDWVTEAIELTTDRFGLQPVLYWSNSFAVDHDMAAPSAAHLPMVAEYHRGYTPFQWADRANWELYAYGAFGGPDVPPGYTGIGRRDLIWQFTSSAEIPGFGGLVDCDFVPDAAWTRLTSRDTPPDPLEALLSNQDYLDRIDDIHAAVGELPPGTFKKIADLIAGLDARTPSQQQVWNLYNNVTDTQQRLINVEVLLQALKDKVTNMSGMDLSTMAEETRAAPTATPDDHRSATRGNFSRPSVMATVDPSTDAQAVTSLSQLSRALFDTETGVSVQVAAEVEKMRKVAEGCQPTSDEIAAAVQRKLADAARRAGLHAATDHSP